MILTGLPSQIASTELVVGLTASKSLLPSSIIDLAVAEAMVGSGLADMFSNPPKGVRVLQQETFFQLTPCLQFIPPVRPLHKDFCSGFGVVTSRNTHDYSGENRISRNVGISSLGQFYLLELSRLLNKSLKINQLMGSPMFLSGEDKLVSDAEKRTWPWPTELAEPTCGREKAGRPAQFRAILSGFRRFRFDSNKIQLKELDSRFGQYSLQQRISRWPNL